MITEDALSAAIAARLDALVRGITTTRGIANRLARQHITGRRSAPRECPITHYLLAGLDLPSGWGIHTTHKYALSCKEIQVVDRVMVPLPGLIQRFIREFDNGEFSFLLA